MPEQALQQEDESRFGWRGQFAYYAAYMHEVRLDVIEGEGPKGAPYLTLSLPGSDGIVATGHQDIIAASVVLAVAARNGLSAEDLWSLLVVAV